MKKLLLIVVILMQPVYGAKLKLPASVDGELPELARFCRLLGGRPHGFQRAVGRADLNGDGINDYVVDDGELQCYGTDGVGIFGNRNGGVTVFLGRADGEAEKAFYYSVFGSKIYYVGKQAKLYLGMAGTYCGQMPESEKRDGYEKCSRPLKWNDKLRRFEIDMQTKRAALYW